MEAEAPSPFRQAQGTPADVGLVLTQGNSPASQEEYFSLLLLSQTKYSPPIQSKSSPWQTKQITACPTPRDHKDRLAAVLPTRSFEVLEGSCYNLTPSLFSPEISKTQFFQPDLTGHFFSRALLLFCLPPLASGTYFFPHKNNMTEHKAQMRPEE